MFMTICTVLAVIGFAGKVFLVVATIKHQSIHRPERFLAVRTK